MRKPSATETNPTTCVTSSRDKLGVLSISPHEDDHLSLQSILSHSEWMFVKAGNLPLALAMLQRHEIAVVLCERDLLPGTWIDVLEKIHARPSGQSLIVTSRLADERLWAEALNLGAWDVLAKPFAPGEVIRSVKSAWHHWRTQTQMPALTMKAMTAA